MFMHTFRVSSVNMIAQYRCNLLCMYATFFSSTFFFSAFHSGLMKCGQDSLMIKKEVRKQDDSTNF